MQITLITTIYNNFDNISVKQGQLLYATDTKNASYDIDNTLRYSLSCTQQIDTDSERTSITPVENTLYIVTTTNLMYRYYTDTGWLNVTDFEAIVDILILADELQTMVIESNGEKYAPVVLAKYIYMADGSTLQSAIDDLMEKGAKVILESKTMTVQIKSSGQKILDIPYPISDYNIYKFPMFVLLGGKYISKDSYAISNYQMILSDTITSTTIKDDVVTFIFVYAHSLADVSLDCESMNGVRWFIGKTDLALDLRQDKDVMVNTYMQDMKQWDSVNQEWSLIFSNRKRVIKRVENSVKVATDTNYVNIGIDGYNEDQDTLIVVKNNTWLNKGKDYTVSIDNKLIKAPDGFTWSVSSSTPTYFYFIILKNLPSTTYNEYNDDNFDGNEIDSLKSEVNDLRAEIVALKDVINKYIDTSSTS